MSADTLDTANPFSRFTYRTLTFFGGLSQTLRLRLKVVCRGPKPRLYFYNRFSLFRFRSPLLTESLRFLFLRVLRCFSSPGSPRIPMDSVYVPWFFTMGVSPFGNLRIEAHLQLPAAYRSLSRPSSAPNAKAFTLCSSSLELNF